MMVCLFLKYDVADAVEGELAEGAVETADGEYRVAAVKDARCAVVVGDVELVAQSKRLMLGGEIAQARGVKPCLCAVLGVAIEVDIGKDPLAKFAVAAVKSRAPQKRFGIDRIPLEPEQFCA